MSRYDGGDPYYSGDYPQQPGTRPHSGLGIASFIIALIVIVLDLLLLVLVLAMGPRGGSIRQQETMAMFAGIGMCGGLLAAVVGLGLGIGGLFQEDRNRAFAVVGVILNGLVLLVIAMLFLIGLAIADRGMRF